MVGNKDITVVLALLSDASDRKILASEGVKGNITVNLPNTTVNEALEKILKIKGLVTRTEDDYILVYTPEELEKVEQRELKSTRIYKPQNISAADLEELLRDQVSQGAKISKTRASQVGVQSNSDQAGGDSLAVPDMVVVEDMEPVLKKLDRIVAEVDVPAPQVLIESVLLSVRLDNENQMGVNFALLRGNSGLAVSGSGATLNAAAGFPPSTLVDGAGKVGGEFADNGHGLKWGVIRGDFTSFVKLLETVGHTTILADSKVLTHNKQRAENQVGSQLGYKTTTSTETSTVENVQFLDVGTQLRVRPFVRPNGRIRMEIHAEKSSGKVDSQTQLPSKDTSQVTTNMTVPSGTTVVIGGLIEEQQQRTVQQIPLLGSVPLIGGLFRDQTTTTTRSELIVLITPRIMSDDDLAGAARIEQDRFEGRRQGLKDSFPQHTRTALARRYYEKACACYDQGDKVAALKLTEVALHFDPFYDLARNLRDKSMFPPEDRSAAMK
ncbi:MAG: hypothetical protein HY000_20755 [Planctomycetes bacterium]|nr:hypothetical protein [Planctomycetota bacterium]